MFLTEYPFCRVTYEWQLPAAFHCCPYWEFSKSLSNFTPIELHRPEMPRSGQHRCEYSARFHKTKSKCEFSARKFIPRTKYKSSGVIWRHLVVTVVVALKYLTNERARILAGVVFVVFQLFDACAHALWYFFLKTLQYKNLLVITSKCGQYKPEAQGKKSSESPRRHHILYFLHHREPKLIIWILSVPFY